MRLCIYSTSFYPSIGGTEKATWLLATEAAGAGHDVTIVTETPAQNWSNPEPDITVVRKPTFHRLRKVYHHSDVLVINGGLSARAFLPAMYTSVKVIPLHAMITDGLRKNGSLKDWVGDQVRRLLAMKADCHVGVSHYVLEAANVEGRVIPNMIDPELLNWRREKEPARKSYDLIFAGRLEKSKGVHLLIQQIAGLHEDGLPVSLLICGDGSARQELMHQVQESGLNELVHFRYSDTSGKLAGYYAESRAVVHTPVANEGFGMTLIEGMAFGIPSVITNIPALPDTAEETAWCLDELNPESLSKVVTSIKNEDREYQQKAARARERAEQFTPQSVYRHWEDLFEELAD